MVELRASAIPIPECCHSTFGFSSKQSKAKQFRAISRAGCLLAETKSRVSISASATLAGNSYYGLAPVGHLYCGRVW